MTPRCLSNTKSRPNTIPTGILITLPITQKLGLTIRNGLHIKILSIHYFYFAPLEGFYGS